MSEDNPYGGPWYVHFWPWFIVILLGTTVVAGLTTVYIAVSGADALVVDNYYKKGKAINRALAGDQEAALREARAEVRFEDGVVIELVILGDLPDRLRLDLSHVTRADFDRSFELERTETGGYAAVGDVPDGRFYATLRPAGDDATWRLRRRVSLPMDERFEMEPSG